MQMFVYLKNAENNSKMKIISALCGGRWRGEGEEGEEEEEGGREGHNSNHSCHLKYRMQCGEIRQSQLQSWLAHSLILCTSTIPLHSVSVI